MIKQSITPQDLVNYLNELSEQDPAAVKALFSLSVPCGKVLANRPELGAAHVDPLGIDPAPQSGHLDVSGLLLGLFGVNDGGPYKWWGSFEQAYVRDDKTCQSSPVYPYAWSATAPEKIEQSLK